MKTLKWDSQWLLRFKYLIKTIEDRHFRLLGLYSKKNAKTTETDLSFILVLFSKFLDISMASTYIIASKGRGCVI